MPITDRRLTGVLWMAPLLMLGTVRCAAATVSATIDVDAREAPRGIMTAHLRLPVSAGLLTLVYPKWLPGRHSPAGPLTSLGGPRFTANGRALSWRRDAVDMNGFSVEIPPGVTSLETDLEIPNGTGAGRRRAGFGNAAHGNGISIDTRMESTAVVPRRCAQR